MPEILASDYNSIQTRVEDVLGLGENGWGAPALYSQPVTNNTVVTAHQWNSLINDVNIIRLHVLNTSTDLSFISTSTSLITQVPGTELSGVADILTVDPTRYSCHPQQFILNDLGTKPLIFGSTSTRTTSWGLSPITISHEATVGFITRLHARYYFNLGNYLVFHPFYLPPDVANNDLDLEWIRWIDWINSSPAQEFRYGRDQYLNTTEYTQVYNSGTLSITVVASKRIDEKNIDFNITFANEATTLLVVSPTVAGYTINI